MKTRLIITPEELEKIKDARKHTKNKNTDTRLRVLELRAEGVTLEKIAEYTGYCRTHISVIIREYFDKGLDYITANNYKGNRRNMTYEEEEQFLAPFLKKAEAGQMVDTNEIKAAYEEKVGHSIGGGQIYYVLHRHGWRKVMPRSKHPNKATEEVIATSKKLTNL